jgi:uncharacterized protein (DUF2267 family)
MDLLGDLKERSFLQTHNQCYAMLRAVLHEFRGYMTVGQAIAFANGLPPVVRAILVENWKPPDQPLPSPSRQDFIDAVIGRLSPHHVPPDSIVSDVFALLVPRAEATKIADAIDSLPAELKQLWDED